MDKVKIGWLFDVVSSGSTPPTSQSKYYENGTINWLNTGDLTDGLVTKIPKKVTNEALLKFPTLKIYEPNSIVMAMYGATIAKLGIVMDYFTTNQACIVLSQPKESVYQKFIFYVLMAKRKDIINESRGGGQPNISQNIVRNIRLSLPEKHEQVLIVQYIDSKIYEIDNLVFLKEKQIQLLEEQRQAMITEAVTKGLNSDVEMKKYGIDWVEEIPEHWEIKYLKDIAKLRRGPFGGALKINDFIDMGNVVYEQQHAINNQTENFRYYISDKKYEEMKSFSVVSGDIIMSCSGTIGKTAIIPKNFREGIINQALLRISPDNNKINSTYLDYFIKSEYFQNQIIDNSYGSAIKNVSSINVIKKIFIFLPSVEEQNMIIEQLSKKLMELDVLINDIVNQQTKLTEYRQSVIHEAVTGKIPVEEMEKYLKEVEDDGN